MTSDDRYDFFLSFSDRDREIAHDIYTILTGAAYSVYYQQTHMEPGRDFLERMAYGLSKSNRLIALLSNNYTSSSFAMAELNAMLVDDPTGKNGLIIPFLIEQFEPPKLLASRVYVNLVGSLQNKAALKDVVLGGIGRDHNIVVPRLDGTSLTLPNREKHPIKVDAKLSCGRRVDSIYVVEQIQEKLEATNIRREDISRIMVCTHELLDNAYDHGCQCEADQITIELAVTKRSVWLLVKNAQEMTSDQIQDSKSSLNGRINKDNSLRGRGLLIASGMGCSIKLSKDKRGFQAIIPYTKIGNEGSRMNKYVVTNLSFTCEIERIVGVQEVRESRSEVFEEVTGTKTNIIKEKINPRNVNYANKEQFKEEIRRNLEVAKSRGAALIVNFDHYDFITSAALSVLLREMLSENYQKVRKFICKPSDAVLTALEASRINDDIPIFMTLEEAIKQAEIGR